jgi:predicted 2-oxoglutarate/Fe(II)-dependent dioxygenase YbiX
MSPDRTFFSSEQQYGRPAVLVLMGADSGPPALATALVPHLGSFADRNADVMVLVDENPRQLFGGDFPSLPIRTIDCGDSLVLVLDRNLRIAMRLTPEPGADIAALCLAGLDGLPSEAARDVSMPAPVVMLPNLLSHAVCRELIALFEAGPTIDGEVARIDAAGTVRSVVDHNKKRRRDLMIDADSALHRMLRDTLLDRCAPEIAKGFQKRVAHTDRILVSRYDDTGGWFRRHRDNAARNVAFREFALTVNLNTGEYAGGHLLFPEYNDHRYLPAAGAGVIFSTALLHEAAPVTSGRRYTLLTFLHSEAAEARRLELVATMDVAGGFEAGVA